MTSDQKLKLLKKLVALDNETETVEFKENNFCKEEIGKRISALSNSANLLDKKRAYLVFGVKDDTHEIVGTKFKPKSEKVGNEILESWLNSMLNPRVNFHIFEFIYEGKSVVMFEIEPAITQPIKFQNIAYIRIASTTRKLSDYPEKERKIWQNIDKKSFGKGIALSGLTASEVLDLLDYAKFFELTKQKLPLETRNFVEKMIEYSLVTKNFDITNLGAILFAKDLNKFPTVSRKVPRVVIYKNDNRAEIEKTQEGHLGYAVAFEGLVNFIIDRLPSNEEITKTLRKEHKMYPEIAIREFIANALIHQDFTITGTGPTIEIFKTRIEIANPGIPLIDTERFIDHAPISRNEDLAKFMRQVGICEEMGTGIDRAILQMEIYQLPAPRFEVGDNFTRVILYAYKKLSEMATEDKIRACYQHAVLRWLDNKRMTNESLRERLQIPKTNYPAASKIITDTLKAKKIKKSEKTKEYIPFWA